jgi:CO/xanthine dehydrogenase Mo-binding subunit
MAAFKHIGQDTRLADGQAKITGGLRFIADLHLRGTLHARLVQSPYAHARIQAIDKTPALALPGLVAILTGADIQPHIADKHNLRLLANEKVAFMGQAVALVLAETEAAAQDGVDHLLIEYDELPAVMTIDAALAKDAPLVNEKGNARSSKPEIRGDIQAGFAEADLIIERTFETPIVHQNSLETHGMVIQPDPVSGGVTVWSATQAPFDVRLEVAELLGVPESAVRVIPTPLGGGFGGKFPIYEPLIALAARLVGAPIRLILSRSEELQATNPAPAIRVHAKMGAKNDGTLVALAAEAYIDTGASRSWLAGFTSWQIANQYRIPHVHVTATNVLTHKPPSGSYRAPCSPTVIFALDTLLDDIAAQLHLDPLAVRQQNFMREGDVLTDGETYALSGADAVFAALAQHPVWQQRDMLKAQGRGVGIAVATWMVGTQPGMANCGLNRDGKLQLNVGIADVSGVGTAFALLAAETFGVAPEDVQVIITDTASGALSGMAAGSMTTLNTGAAVIQAAADAKQQVLEIAAHEFEAAIEDIDIVNGSVQVRGVPDKALPLSKIASKTLGSPYAPVLGRGRTISSGESAPVVCGQLAEIEVDPETGAVRVLQLVMVQDAGVAVNPASVRGQMAGGAVQGLGWALYEQLLYEENGQLLTGSWMDYAMPHSTQTAPHIETIIVEVPAANSTLGVRGVGEPPVIPTAAAVANAIAHISGVRLTELPMTPVRVYAALQAK